MHHEPRIGAFSLSVACCQLAALAQEATAPPSGLATLWRLDLLPALKGS